MRSRSWPISSAFMPAAGSSSSSSFGRAASARASSRRRCSPNARLPASSSCLCGEAGELEQLADLGAHARRAAQPAREEALARAVLGRVLRDPQVLPDGELAEEADVLERARDAEAEPLVHRHAAEVRAAEQDRARRSAGRGR